MAKRFAVKRPSIDAYMMFYAAPALPSGALVNAILEHADIRQDLGDGKVLLRLSPRRANNRLVRRGLGRQADRLAQMSLVWDEEDGQVVSVCDAAEPAEAGSWNEPSELDRFELTEAALAYIAEFERSERT
jgi:hypothetical protein